MNCNQEKRLFLGGKLSEDLKMRNLLKFLFGGVMVCTAPRLPLMRELSAKLTEGEKMLRF